MKHYHRFGYRGKYNRSGHAYVHATAKSCRGQKTHTRRLRLHWQRAVLGRTRQLRGPQLLSCSERIRSGQICPHATAKSLLAADRALAHATTRWAPAALLFRTNPQRAKPPTRDGYDRSCRARPAVPAASTSALARIPNGHLH